MRSLRQYDVGVEIRIPVRDQDDQLVDLDGSETGYLLLRSPSGRRKKLAASIDSAADEIVYVLAALDLDEWGIWSLQGELVSPSLHVRTTTILLEAEPTLDASILIVDALPTPIPILVPSPRLALV